LPAAASPADELRNAERAALLGARMVMLVALLRVDTRAEFAPRRPWVLVNYGTVTEREEECTVQGAEGSILGCQSGGEALS
jgi:hypothetical protein